MDGASESNSRTTPDTAVEDNSIQILQDSSTAATSAKVGVVGPGLATATFHGWVCKHYFKVVSEDSKNLRVHCTLRGGSKTLFHQPEILLLISRSI